jgi:hypothetical protein
MPTRIFFSNGEQVTVSDEPEAVAAALGGGGFAKLDRPWGDEAIYVNPVVVNYIEAQDERAPDIEAMEASTNPATAPGPGAPAGAAGGPAAGTPGGPPVQPPPR